MRTALVIGAGLSGAAVAAALAQRGVAVTVLDAAPHPAAGASSLPVGLMAPLVARRDTAAAQLSRLGLAHTTAQARAWLRQGIDWQPCGAMQYGPQGTTGPATQDVWHPDAAWIKPAALVRAWLSAKGVQFVGNAAVAQLTWQGGQWTACSATLQSLAQADIAVVASAAHSAQLLQNLRLQDAAAPFADACRQIAQHLHAVAGQVIHGPWNADWQSAAPARQGLHHACNGNGHFIAAVPALADTSAQDSTEERPLFWLSGSTYEHHGAQPTPTADGIRANVVRLSQLLPCVQNTLAQQQAAGAVQAWAAQRCATRDRLPVVGAVGEVGAVSASPLGAFNAPSTRSVTNSAGPSHHSGLFLCTGMGSRGLSFASLCAHALAAQICGEPGPLPHTLQQAIDPARLLLA